MLTLLAAAALAQDALVPGDIVVDRPTIVTLGVQWLVTGDDDFDATVGVRWRKAGDSAWNQGIDLFRVHPEDVHGWSVQPQFAGSVFDLIPATTYEIELHAVDPDGLDQTEVAQATTRDVPRDPPSPRAVTATDAKSLQQALDDARPGDIISVQAGTYGGPFAIYNSGDPGNPVVIRGVSADTVVLDGGGCGDCNVLEVYGSYTYVEELTLQNANRALRFQGDGAIGDAVLRVTARDVSLGIGSDVDQRDFVVCDNDLTGPLQWPHVYTDDDGQFANVDGINLEGSGHVICHNRLIGWGDAIKIEQDGSRADDVYGNEVLSAYDNGLELDTGEGNVRAFRNRFTNTYATISFQPIWGGPAYAWRNVIVNVAHEQMKFHSIGGNEETSGILAWHNTFVSADRALTLDDNTTSHHFQVTNNLFVGPTSTIDGRTASWTGGIDDGRFDGDGWYPDGRFDFGGAGDWPDLSSMAADGWGGVLLSEPIFASGLTAPPDYTQGMPVDDGTPATGSGAIDAALPIPGFNDQFAGAGPDIGAQEVGCDVPIYGVRPVGVDETAGPPTCGEGGPTGTGYTGSGDTGSPATGGNGDPTGANGGADGGGDSGGCGCDGSGGPGTAWGWVVALVAVARRGSLREPGRVRTTG